MGWNEVLFKITMLGLSVIGMVITYYVIPYIKSKTTNEQRQDLVYWTQIAIKLAEQIYKDKGQGALKFEYVVEWLNKQGIKFTEEQVKALIDVIVDYFNNQGWDKVFAE